MELTRRRLPMLDLRRVSRVRRRRERNADRRACSSLRRRGSRCARSQMGQVGCTGGASRLMDDGLRGRRALRRSRAAPDWNAGVRSNRWKRRLSIKPMLVNQIIDVIVKEGMIDREKVTLDATIESLDLKSIDIVMILTAHRRKIRRLHSDGWPFPRSEGHQEPDRRHRGVYHQRKSIIWLQREGSSSPAWAPCRPRGWRGRALARRARRPLLRRRNPIHRPYRGRIKFSAQVQGFDAAALSRCRHAALLRSRHAISADRGR